MEQKFINLGLPSGTLWAEKDEHDYFMPDEAVEKFGDALPTIDQFNELIENTYKYWDVQECGLWFVSKINNEKIFLRACGYCDKDDTYYYSDEGYYCTSNFNDNNKPFFFYFDYKTTHVECDIVSLWHYRSVHLIAKK